VVRFEVRFPSDKEQSSLLIDADAPVYDFVRLRVLNGEPVSLDLTVMPVGLVPGLNKSHLESSVFRYVQETLGLKLMGSYRVVRAMKPDELDKHIFTARPTRCWRLSRLSIWKTVRRWSMPTATIATITAALFW
jgi:GntR family transcriptional regulator